MAWADARSGVVSGIDQGYLAMENQADASPRLQKEFNMANWDVRDRPGDFSLKLGSIPRNGVEHEIHERVHGFLTLP